MSWLRHPISFLNFFRNEHGVRVRVWRSTYRYKIPASITLGTKIAKFYIVIECSNIPGYTFAHFLSVKHLFKLKLTNCQDFIEKDAITPPSLKK